MTEGEQSAHDALRKKRRRFYVFIVLFYLSFFAALPFLVPARIGKTLYYVVTLVILAVGIPVSNLIWTCPVCGKPLGSNLHPKSCRRCGATFEETDQETPTPISAP